MMSKEAVTDYWFAIEPYVYVCISGKNALLYNCLDGMTVESDKIEVIDLLFETLQKENCGIVLLNSDRCEQKSIKEFIWELREKYMGDIIDVKLSKGRPIQLLPFFNLESTGDLFVKHNFSSGKNILNKLSEISVHIDQDTDVSSLCSFIQSVPGKLIINIIGSTADNKNYPKLLSFLNDYQGAVNIISPFTDILPLELMFNSNFTHTLLVRFPVDMQLWESSREVLLNYPLSFKYVFDVTSSADCLCAEQLIEHFMIERYRINPVYTGANLDFFKKNVFLTKEDIFAIPMSLEDIFTNQSINIYDFGKINIMSNGDVYANVNYPLLGNIYKHSISEIVNKEIEEGKSWLRVRNQNPCSTCTYQWLCPSPSDFETVIGRPNLCHIR